MASLRTASCVISSLFLGISPLLAQDAETPGQPTATQELSALRKLIETQSAKIDALSQQVEALARTISEPKSSSAGQKPLEEAPSTANDSLPTPSLTGSNAVHVVAKGETLTSIARHFKVTVAELLKLNKIENDRTLQIGQTLVLPAPKPQESPAGNQTK